MLGFWWFSVDSSRCFSSEIPAAAEIKLPLSLMDHKQQLALRPISTRRVGSVAGEVAAAMERSSLAATSFRVYYSLRPGAVPFLWESKPGTPKSGGGATAAVSPAPAEMVIAHQHQLPPISPPPSSYHSFQLKKGRRCRPKPSCQAAAGLVRTLLAALGIRRRSHRRPSASLV